MNHRCNITKKAIATCNPSTFFLPFTMRIPIPTPRPQRPIEWNKALNAWTVWQYPQVVEILKDPRFTAISTPTAHNATIPQLNPKQDKYRKFFSNILQSHLQEAKKTMHSTAHTICKSYSRPLRTPFDLQEKITLPWCQKMALQLTETSNYSQHHQLLQYAQSIFSMTKVKPKPEAEKDAIALSQFFLQHLQKHRYSSNQNLISSLAQNEQMIPYLLSPIIQLFVGFTTSLPLLLGNLIFTLLQSPPIHRQLFLQAPNRHIHNLLRITSPAQVIFRIATEEIQFSNHTFKRKDNIALLLSHANHDENTFQNSCTSKLSSSQAPHLGLGKGKHACLGTPLIREACTILPPILLQAFPNLKVNSEKVIFGGSRAIWGVKKLFVNQLCNF